MAERRARPVLAGVLIALAAVLVFPWQWVRSYRMAQQHTDADPAGPTKVLAAIAVGVVLAGAGAFGLWMAQEALQEGAYDTLDEQLQVAVREQEYQDALSTIEQKDSQIPIIQGNLVNRTADVDQALTADLAVGDPALHATVQDQWTRQKALAEDLAEAAQQGDDVTAARADYTADGRIEQLQTNWTLLLQDAGVAEERAQELESHLTAAVSLPDVLAQAYVDRQQARERVDALERHHAFYLSIQDDIEAQDDEAVYAAISQFSTQTGATDTIDMTVVDSRFEHKSDAVDDMVLFFVYWPVFGWFSIVGLLFAPLVFVQGAILHRVWTPSDTVGYRQYPSFAMGMFLLLGAFNVPAPLFAAWSMADIERRSVEGQISL